jgi:hypothetical protein
MEKKISIEALIRSARSETTEEFKSRFKQKWYDGLPAFRWSELQLTRELKATIYTENPTVWLMHLPTEEVFNDKVWGVADVTKILSFDYLERGHDQLNDDELFNLWLEENILSGIGMLNFPKEDCVIVYTGGTGPYAKEWVAHFENELTK